MCELLILAALSAKQVSSRSKREPPDKALLALYVACTALSMPEKMATSGHLIISSTVPRTDETARKTPGHNGFLTLPVLVVRQTMTASIAVQVSKMKSVCGPMRT